MTQALIKFSSEDCGTCHKMSFYDAKVAKELDLEFIDVKMQDTATYRKYRQILMAQYPDKKIWDGPHTSSVSLLKVILKLLAKSKADIQKENFAVVCRLFYRVKLNLSGISKLTKNFASFCFLAIFACLLYL